MHKCILITNLQYLIDIDRTRFEIRYNYKGITFDFFWTESSPRMVIAIRFKNLIYSLCTIVRRIHGTKMLLNTQRATAWIRDVRIEQPTRYELAYLKSRVNATVTFGKSFHLNTKRVVLFFVPTSSFDNRFTKTNIPV